jgi:PHP domain-containing protein
MTTLESLTETEVRLNDFDPAVRQQALDELAALAGTSAASERDIANMHAHTFFSFNAYGHSPSSLVWLAKRQGFKLIGMVDFDVLDGVDEFLNACEKLGVRGSAGIETRVFIPEFATREINSPGEPGVCYHMGIGFTRSAVPESAAGILADLRQRADQRNREMVARINAYLDPVKVDYELDILALAPAGNPTERHIVVAYIEAAKKTASDAVQFWADKLNTPLDQIAKIIGDAAKLQNLIRAKLMKQGGVGYAQPGPQTFPAVAPFHRLIEACGALPCAAWLDGTSPGEQAIGELLELLISQGVVAFNIIPDRNWNIADAEVKRQKLQNLYDVVALADRLALPINVGTEMNSFGQKLVDDFDAPELAPVRQSFLDGAHFIYGHTALQRQFGLGYQSAWAKAKLTARRERNQFYTKVGYAAQPGKMPAVLSSEMTPDEILSKLG